MVLYLNWYTMAVHQISKSTRVGEAHKTLTASTYQLDAISGRPTRCVRRITCLASTTITSLKDPGENDDAPGAVDAGTVLDGDFSAITFTGGPVFVQW